MRALSEDIGPRPSTSDRERAASEYVAGRLRACGWEVEVEPFRSVTSFSWAYGTFFLAFVLAALLLPSVPLAACALAWLALVAFALESSGIETLTRVLPRRESQNVVARYARAGGSREADRAPRVVLSAHVDSARSALLWHPRLVGTFRALLLLAIGAMLALAVLATVALFTRPMWLLLAAGAAGAYLALVMLALLDRELRWQVTPGANDNASGVAALLGLAETLAREPDAASEV